MPLQLYKIASVDLTATVSSVTFSSIPQGYTDLKIVHSSKTLSGDSNANDPMNLSFNGSSANFSAKLLAGTGSAASSGTNSYYGGLANSSISSATNTFCNTEVYIPNYTSSNNKSFSADGVTEANQTAAITLMVAGLWSQTTAITSITFTPAVNQNIVANSTFTLYGIL
jgi:hypothetical protein